MGPHYPTTMQNEEQIYLAIEIAMLVGALGFGVLIVFGDLPPLKWSSLKYVLTLEDEINGEEAAHG